MEKIKHNTSFSLGISGGPGKQYQECEKVMKEFCEDVPRNEDVEGDVETCVNTPKEVRGRSQNHQYNIFLQRSARMGSRELKNKFVRESRVKQQSQNEEKAMTLLWWIQLIYLFIICPAYFFPN